MLAEAKRRARQRRLLLALGFVALVGLAAGLPLAFRGSGGGTGGGSASPAASGWVGALAVPQGASGIATIVYGRLSATTKSGFHVHGLPVNSAALSPGARYLAVGIGHSLVLLAPGGRRLWSRPLPTCPPLNGATLCGLVASIAWAPNGSRIAYEVLTNTRNEVLHVIRRNGTHDTVIDRTARPAEPSWRADSGALAYAGAGTRLGPDTSPIIYDVTHRSRHVIHWPVARAPLTNLAFAPRGRELAVATENAVLLVGGRDRVVWRGKAPPHVGWLGRRLAVSEWILPGTRHIVTQLYTVTPAGAMLDHSSRMPGTILAIRGRTVALRAGTSVLAGPISSLRRVLRFSLQPCYATACEIPIGDQDISIG